MHLRDKIRTIEEVYESNSVLIPEEAGVYAFWWIAPKSELIAGNRDIILKGPVGNDVRVRYEDWWPDELVFPCLYVGKSTRLRTRIGQHILRTKPGRLHSNNSGSVKSKPYNSSCQLRWGIEHVFPNDQNSYDRIKSSVGISWNCDFGNNPVAERFYEEDRLIGNWRPWFNIDSER